MPSQLLNLAFPPHHPPPPSQLFHLAFLQLAAHELHQVMGRMTPHLRTPFKSSGLWLPHAQRNQYSMASRYPVTMLAHDFKRYVECSYRLMFKASVFARTCKDPVLIMRPQSPPLKNMSPVNGNLRLGPNSPPRRGIKTTIMGEYLTKYFRTRFSSFSFDRHCNGNTANNRTAEQILQLSFLFLLNFSRA
ncbi:hypothetical protein F5144DRAFT_578102 [Chaetomium tenue]|uniref:Uncharacterized protein n=1 Tax=Chaetomium tenue TaxID=1854479 RepID=A0ACB7P4N6_9PEZI|nr:hypothetical protein F5144DRAFT_578102 [Chaetomium globosum]